jgi:hypothetical protein
MASTLTTLSAVRGYLGLSEGDGHDALLEALIGRVSDGIARYVGQDLALQSYEESHDGGSEAVILLRRPVESVWALSDDDAPLDADEYALYREAGVIRRKSGAFAAGEQTVAVGYLAGYSPLPGDVEQAAVEWVAHKFASRGPAAGRGISDEHVGDYSVSYDDAGDIPERVRATLDRYREAVVRAVR